MKAWQVLMVCTGNLCRSPTAEYLATAALRAGLGDGAEWISVTSAGTHARPGMPMHPYAAAVLAERGVTDPALHPHGFASATLDATLVAGADLVLCAERGHRAAAVTLVPKAVSRTFTLREFARLTAGMTPADVIGGIPAGSMTGPDSGATTVQATTTTDRIRWYAGALVAGAVRQRGSAVPEDPDDDSIADPIGQSIETFRHCADEITRALNWPLELLIRAVCNAG